MIPEPSVDWSQMFRYLWVAYTLFVVAVVGVSWALFYHWAKYQQMGDIASRFSQILFLVGVVFLVFLSFAFFINI